MDIIMEIYTIVNELLWNMVPFRKTKGLETVHSHNLNYARNTKAYILQYKIEVRIALFV